VIAICDMGRCISWCNLSGSSDRLLRAGPSFQWLNFPGFQITPWNAGRSAPHESMAVEHKAPLGHPGLPAFPHADRRRVVAQTLFFLLLVNRPNLAWRDDRSSGTSPCGGGSVGSCWLPGPRGHPRKSDATLRSGLPPHWSAWRACPTTLLRWPSVAYAGTVYDCQSI
jgi:hypothetical protein